MPTLAVIGDVHAHLRHLEQVLAECARRDVDGVLLVGDLGANTLPSRRPARPQDLDRYHRSLDQVFGAVAGLGRPWAWVAGNHDLPTVDGPECVDHGRVRDVGGLRVAGIGGAGPMNFGFPYEWEEEAIRARQVPECDVLLVHCPPLRTALDFVPKRGEHVGSAAIRERAERHEGFLVCGHIHESPGAERLGACLCLNAGGLGRPYAAPQLGLVVRDADGDRVGHLDLTSRVERWWT